MPLTLEDIMKLPDQPSDDHLAALGILKKPEPPPVPTVKTPMTPSSPLDEKLQAAAMLSPHKATIQPMAPAQMNASEPTDAMALHSPEAAGAFTAATPAPPELGFKEKMALPQMSAAVHPGTSQFYENQLERNETAKENPFGSPENHPGLFGKIGHVLGRVGNVALDTFAPATASLIPGTDMNKRFEESATRDRLGQAQEHELAQQTEQTRAKHEENVSNLAQDKLDETVRNNQAKDEAGLSKQGLKRDEQGNIVADQDSPIYQMGQQKMKNAEVLRDSVVSFRKSQSDLNEAKEEVERAKNDPNSPAYKMAAQKMAMAQLAHEVAAKNLELHEKQFSNKVEEQELVKPSGQSQSRGSAAQAVLDLIPDLKGLVNKHRADMGPIMGRINRGELAIGNVDPEVAKLYSAMKSFYALQPAVHGFRNAEFVKDFEHALGTLERNPDAFIAGMEGLRPTLESVAKEGKTYHKRIVEGRETKPGNNNQPANGPATAPPTGKVSVYDTNGQQHFVLKEKVNDFLKDPKYKGWSQNAPTAH